MRLPCLALAALLITACQAEPRKPDAEVALESSLHLVVKAKISGQNVKFLVDSGSTNCRIQPASAARLGLVEGQIAELMKLGVSIRGQRLERDLAFGPTVFEKVPFDLDPVFVDQTSLAIDVQEFDGVIGLSFLQHHGLGLNLVDRKLAIWRNGRVSKEDRDAWMGATTSGEAVLNRVKQEDHEWFGVSGSIGGRKSKFILDIGAPLLLMTTKQAKSIGVSPAVPTAMQFLGGNGSGSLAVAPNLEVAGRKVSLSWTGVLGDDQKDMEKLLSHKGLFGLVGLETFRGTRTLIDFPAAKLSCLTDLAAVAWHDYLGSLGFRVGDSGGKGIAIVRHDSIAAKAGLETLDILVEINGKPASSGNEWTAPEGWQPKEPLRLKVKRGEQTLELIFNL